MLVLLCKSALQQAKITHVLSLLRKTPDEARFESYEHMTVEVLDQEDENLIEHFPRMTRFIQEALDGGGAVLVHWYAWISLNGAISSIMTFCELPSCP